VRIVRPLHDPARTGSAVSVLTGPDAGQWRRVALVLDRDTYVLDAPLPAEAGVISMSRGFVDEAFVRNTIVAREARGAQALVLVGNHFGTVVRDNRIVGAGEGLPDHGHAHRTPDDLGMVARPVPRRRDRGNTIEDSERGGLLGVEHGKGIKTNAGRVYMSVTLRNNTVRWGEEFLARLRRGEAKGPPPGITVGYLPTLDPGELVVQEQGNRVGSAPEHDCRVRFALAHPGRPDQREADPGIAPAPRRADIPDRARWVDHGPGAVILGDGSSKPYWPLWGPGAPRTPRERPGDRPGDARRLRGCCHASSDDSGPGHRLRIASASAADEPFFTSDAIFPPEPFHNHASCVVEMPDGDLLATCITARGNARRTT
jgi:hypothetical protein